MINFDTKIRVLVVGGTGYIGRRIVKASLAEGHDTYVLQRKEIDYGLDIDKLHKRFSPSSTRELTLSRARLMIIRLKLVEAIKEAGNVKRFLPSEFGMDPALLGHALEPGRVTFDEKMMVRRAIEEAKIPFTYISANCFAGYFVGNLSQMGTLIPPKGSQVQLYGDGNVKVLQVIYHISNTFGLTRSKAKQSVQIWAKTRQNRADRPLQRILHLQVAIGVQMSRNLACWKANSIPYNFVVYTKSRFEGLDLQKGKTSQPVTSSAAVTP